MASRWAARSYNPPIGRPGVWYRELHLILLSRTRLDRQASNNARRIRKIGRREISTVVGGVERDSRRANQFLDFEELSRRDVRTTHVRNTFRASRAGLKATPTPGLGPAGATLAARRVGARLRKDASAWFCQGIVMLTFVAAEVPVAL